MPTRQQQIRQHKSHKPSTTLQCHLRPICSSSLGGPVLENEWPLVPFLSFPTATVTATWSWRFDKDDSATKWKDYKGKCFNRRKAHQIFQPLKGCRRGLDSTSMGYLYRERLWNESSWCSCGRELATAAPIGTTTTPLGAVSSPRYNDCLSRVLLLWWASSCNGNLMICP